MNTRARVDVGADERGRCRFRAEDVEMLDGSSIRVKYMIRHDRAGSEIVVEDEELPIRLAGENDVRAGIYGINRDKRLR